MENDLENKVKHLIDGLKCPKDFKCCKQGLENLCKARDFGVETALQCLELDARECPFSKPVAAWYLCKCPIRNYLAKELKV
jgi:hypothetical protein